jgi:branched-chain amino acid transport system permease protein
MPHQLLIAILDGIEEGSVYGLMAAGLTLVVGVLDIINIAQGALVILGAYLSYALSVYLHVNLFLGLLITVPALFGLGMLINWAVLQRLRPRDRVLMSVVATFGVALLIQGILSAVFGTNYVQLHAAYIEQSFQILGVYVPYIYFFGFLLAAGVMALLAVFLYRTRFGTSIRAFMQNRRGAELIGINGEAVTMVAFSIGVAVTAVGGMFFGAVNTFTPNSGNDLISRLLTVVILGGMGSIWGALGAAIAMLTLENLVSIFWSPAWADGSFYLVLILLLLLRPRGLAGRSLATLE